MIRAHRAQAALHMDAVMNAPSTTQAEIAAMNKHFNVDNADTESSVGGVPLDRHMLDDDDDDLQTVAALTIADDEEEGRRAGRDQADLINFSDEDSDTTTTTTAPQPKLKGKAVAKDDYPTLTEAALHKAKKGKAAVQSPSLIDSLDENDKKPLLPKIAPTFSTGLYPIEKGTGTGTGPTIPNFREAILPGNQGKDMTTATDWDNAKFKRHPIDGQYHCPFQKCK